MVPVRGVHAGDEGLAGPTIPRASSHSESILARPCALVLLLGWGRTELFRVLEHRVNSAVFGLVQPGCVLAPASSPVRRGRLDRIPLRGSGPYSLTHISWEFTGPVVQMQV